MIWVESELSIYRWGDRHIVAYYSLEGPIDLKFLQGPNQTEQ